MPEPGQPEGLAVAPDGTVYAGTDVAPFGLRPEGIQPSRVFAFTPGGQLKRSYTITGESYLPWYGLFGLAVDGDGIIYALDHNPARVLAIDPVTGAQMTYASFPQLQPCSIASAGSECKDTTGDLGSFPNFIAFAPDGTMYVTDTSQALVWRVPRGGGQPKVFYTNRGLESLFGPNDLALTPDGRTLFFGLSTPSFDGQLLAGLYAIPIRSDGSAGPLRQVWQAQLPDFPEGGTIAQSGRIYVSAGGANQIVVLSPQGREVRRIPSSSSENNALPVPLNEPATIAFDGSEALVTNHAWTVYDPQAWAILDYHSSETGGTLFHPIVRPFATGAGNPIQPPTPSARAGRVRLTVSPDAIYGGQRARFRFSATAIVAGRARSLQGAVVVFDRRRARTNREGVTWITARLARPGRYRATVREPGLLDGAAVVRSIRRRR